MTKEELKRKIEDNHNHFKEVAENYVNESWGSFLDLNYVDLVLAGIGVGKIIALEEEKRITELEEKITYYKSIVSDEYIDEVRHRETYIAELKSENQKWKDEWQEQVQKAIDEGYARTLQTIQLTKAKEIIKELCGMVRELNKPNVQLTNVDYSLSEAERFIKE